MATVGAYLRVSLESQQAIQDQLALLEGVSVLDIDKPGTVGLVIEAADLNAAHALLQGDIQQLDGVLGAWPVYAHFEPENEESNEEGPSQAP